MTRGQVLADTFADLFGINGPIFGCEADWCEVTVWRAVQTSDGRSIAMFMDSDGEINDACRVAETFDLTLPV